MVNFSAINYIVHTINFNFKGGGNNLPPVHYAHQHIICMRYNYQGTTYGEYNTLDLGVIIMQTMLVAIIIIL